MFYMIKFNKLGISLYFITDVNPNVLYDKNLR